MKENLESVIVETLLSAKEITGEAINLGKAGAIKAYEFAEAQIPEILREIIMFNRIELTCTFFGLLILSGVFAYVAWHIGKKIATSDFFRGGEFVIAIPIVGFLASSISAFSDFSAVVKVWFAPRLFLIEYFAELMKKVSN